MEHILYVIGNYWMSKIIQDKKEVKYMSWSILITSLNNNDVMSQPELNNCKDSSGENSSPGEEEPHTANFGST